MTPALWIAASGLALMVVGYGAMILHSLSTPVDKGVHRAPVPVTPVKDPPWTWVVFGIGTVLGFSGVLATVIGQLSGGPEWVVFVWCGIVLVIAVTLRWLTRKDPPPAAEEQQQPAAEEGAHAGAVPD